MLEHLNKLLRTPLDHTDVAGRVRRAAAAAQGRHRADVEDLPRAHRRRAAARPGDDRRRQADDLPGDGARRRRRGRPDTARAGRPRATERTRASPSGCRCSVPAGSRRGPTSGSPSPARAGSSIGRIDHLLGRFGGLVDEVLTLIAERPELGQPLSGADGYLAAEVVYAVTHEGARHLDDVLTRRTHISIETFDRGTSAARPAAELMAAELGWDDDAARGRGRPLPAPRRGRAAEPGEADRPGGRRGARAGARRALGGLTSPLNGLVSTRAERQGVPMTAFISHTSIDCRNAYELSEWWKQVLEYVDDPDDPNEPGARGVLDPAPRRRPPAAVHRGARGQAGQEPDPPRPPPQRRHPRRGARTACSTSAPRRSTTSATGDGTGWVGPADPEGNEFCILRRRARRRWLRDTARRSAS